MKKRIANIIICILFVIPIMSFVMSGRSLSPEVSAKMDKYFTSESTNLEPHAKTNGHPYKICYIDIDPYPPSGEMLYYLIKKLYDTGWIVFPDGKSMEDLPFDPTNLDAGKFIDYLADMGTGDYISFSRDQNYYIALEDDATVQANIRKGILNGDVDLILCLGTSPGELAINKMAIRDTPIMVYYSVDPVASGLSKEQEYSGLDNVWCHTSSEVYKNQLAFYHDAYPFKKLGMVYYSESVAAVATYREAAKGLGVTLEEATIKTYEKAEEAENYYKNLEDAYRDMVDNRGIDAFLLSADMIKEAEKVPHFMDIFYEKNIPVFVQNSEFSVASGATMIMSASDAQSQAPFAIDAMVRIFGGEKPGSIYQKFIPSPYVTINLKSANRIGFDINDEIIRMAEKIY